MTSESCFRIQRNTLHHVRLDLDKSVSYPACWSSVNIGSIPALDGKFLKEGSCAFQRITAGPFNASTAKMLLTGRNFGLGWTAGVSTLPVQQPVSGLLFLSKQGSTGQRSRHASSHDACIGGAMAQVYDVPWHYTTGHFGYIGGLNWSRSLLFLPPQRLHAAASASVRQQEQTEHLAKHWQPEFGTCLALSAGMTSPQLFVDSRTSRKATRQGLVVAAFCSFCNSPCTAQRFHQVANDHGGSCTVDVWTSVFLWSTTIDAPNLPRVSLKSGRQFSYASCQRDVPWLSILHSCAGANGCLRSRLQVSEALW